MLPFNFSKEERSSVINLAPKGQTNHEAEEVRKIYSLDRKKSMIHTQISKVATFVSLESKRNSVSKLNISLSKTSSQNLLEYAASLRSNVNCNQHNSEWDLLPEKSNRRNSQIGNPFITKLFGKNECQLNVVPSTGTELMQERSRPDSVHCCEKQVAIDCKRDFHSREPMCTSLVLASTHSKQDDISLSKQTRRSVLEIKHKKENGFNKIMKEENFGNDLKLKLTNSEYKNKIEDAIKQFDEMESQFKRFKENPNDLSPSTKSKTFHKKLESKTNKWTLRSELIPSEDGKSDDGGARSCQTLDHLQDFAAYETSDTIISAPYNTRRAWWVDNNDKDC